MSNIELQLPLFPEHLDCYADLSSQHWIAPGELFITVARFFLQLMPKLTPCSELLYFWVLGKAPAGSNIKFDLKDFQAWTGEHRKRPYTMRQIRNAVTQLEDYQLLVISKEEVTAKARHAGPVVNHRPRSQQQGKKVQEPEKNFPDTKKTSTHQPETTAQQESEIPTKRSTKNKAKNLKNNNSGQVGLKTEPTSHPVVVEKNQNLNLSTEPTPVETELAKETLSNRVEPLEQAKPLGLDSNPDQTSLKTLTPNQNDQFSAEAAQEFFEEIEAAGVQLNATLTKLICSATAQIVSDALETLKEGIEAGKVQRPAAFLHDAIKGQWKPSRVEDPRASQKAPAKFSEWFNLARELRIATAAMKTDSGSIMIYTPNGEAHPWELILAMHPLEELQALVELKRQHDRRELNQLYPVPIDD